MRGVPETQRKAGRDVQGRGRGGGKSRKRSSRKVEQIGTSAFQQSPRTLSITVPVPTNSPNEWVWKHWSKYREIKKGWLDRLYSASIQHCGIGKFGHPVENASLTIERVGIKELDEDNLKGGVKPVIDCLIKLGFLANDTPDVIQVMDVFQTQVGTYAEQATRITIIDRES